MIWNSDSSRFTSTTWPTPLRGDRSQTITAAARAVTSSVSAIGGSSGRPSGLAVDRGEPAHRLGDRGEPGLGRIRPVLPEAGDAQDDEARVARREHLGAEAEPFERARRKFSMSTWAWSHSCSKAVAARRVF